MNELHMDPALTKVTEALREYILADNAARDNPCGWMSFHGPVTDPVWAKYYELRDVYSKAKSKLWDVTDIEYGDDAFRSAVWTWRFWSVQARKCCHYINKGESWRASWTMKMLAASKSELVKICSLTDIYKSASESIEEHFPNLKAEKTKEKDDAHPIDCGYSETGRISNCSCHLADLNKE